MNKYRIITKEAILKFVEKEKRRNMEKEWEKKNPYTSDEMEALSALCDTFLPSIDVPLDHSSPPRSILKFFQTSASMAGTPHRVAVLVGEKIRHPKQFLSRLALRLLSTWIGTFILCGRKSLSPHFPYLQKFSEVPLNQREEILQSWCDSSFLLLRILYSALKIFTLLIFFTQVNEKEENVTWEAIGYRRPDPNPNTGEKPGEEDKFGPLHKGIISLNKSKEVSLDRLQNLGFSVSILQHAKNTGKSPSPSFVLKCDAVVVGSGSGGGVVAGVLAQAGYKVLVLEKGGYYARSRLSLLEGQALDQMYMGHGIMGTENMNVLLLAGSTVGGGSTINWSASIKTPPHVVKDWSENYGLELFGSKAYDEAMHVVCQRMGVQSEFCREGFNNAILRRGCEHLGYAVETIPRNAPADHYCGACCFGCKDGRKKGVSETWLVDMVESRNGIILPECEAVRVITRGGNDGKRAAGVGFEFDNGGEKEMAIVEAEVTVVACGAISTPPLLRRSGLRNANIGRHLHLHPVVLAWGYFPDAWPEPNKKSYEGGIITAMSNVAMNNKSSGYGAVIQTPALHPGMFSALMPWLSGVDIRRRMLKFSRTAHIFALARDKGSGKVISPTNICYRIDKEDQESLTKGVEKVLRILAAAGAEEIGTHHRDGRVLNVKHASAEELERFVKKESSRPLKKLSSPICSAHQMGSCRMGVDPKGSAVRPTGETWEVKGLYVADSSVFPSALGVNPMVTIQAIAYCTAQSVVEALGRKKSGAK